MSRKIDLWPRFVKAYPDLNDAGRGAVLQMMFHRLGQASQEDVLILMWKLQDMAQATPPASSAPPQDAPPIAQASPT